MGQRCRVFLLARLLLLVAMMPSKLNNPHNSYNSSHKKTSLLSSSPTVLQACMYTSSVLAQVHPSVACDHLHAVGDWQDRCPASATSPESALCLRDRALIRVTRANWLIVAGQRCSCIRTRHVAGHGRGHHLRLGPLSLSCTLQSPPPLTVLG